MQYLLVAATYEFDSLATLPDPQAETQSLGGRGVL